MANPIYQTVSATGAATPVILDWFQSPFNVSFAVEVPAGVTATFGVQYTLDDVNDPTWTPIWFDDTNVPAGTATSKSGNYQWPVRAVRVNVSAIASGSIQFAVLQGQPL